MWFFSDRINVEKTFADSAQAVVFYGTEIDMKIEIVLKQYSGSSFKEIIREIKLFTMLEKERVVKDDPKILIHIFANGPKHDGLP